MYVGGQLAHKNAVDFLIEFLKQLQIILDLDYSLLLIDECSEALPEAQVEIFRLFKAIRGSTSYDPDEHPSCSFFIGSVYPRGETYYPTREKDGFSFEPSQDCTTDFLQWDEADTEGYEKFFTEMLFSRAREVIKYTGNSNKLITDLFDSRDTFLLAIYAAHGIPRRFWELIRRAYDNNQITRERLSIAIHEVARMLVLDSGYLNDKDRSFVYEITHRVKSKNGGINGENRKFRRNIPQNIYFNADIGVSKLITKLVMHGVIHNKSRMRTKNRGRPKPLYALDIGVVFYLGVIPEAKFVHFLKTELFRCAKINYDNAFYIGEKDFIHCCEQYTSVDVNNFLDDNELESEVEVDQELEFYGTIKEYNGKIGLIEADDMESCAEFQKNNLDSSCIDKLIIGDRVEFTNKWLQNGIRIALKIRKIDTTNAEGLVKRFDENAYGTIEVNDGGSDAYFFAKDVKESIEAGDYVEFILEESEKGRTAREIRQKVIIENPSKTKEDIVSDLKSYIIYQLELEVKPLTLTQLAYRLINDYGDMAVNSQWFGYKSFKNLLDTLDLQNVTIDNNPPGYIFLNEQTMRENALELYNKLRIIGIPKLNNNEYNKVFNIIGSYVNKKGNFAFSEMARNIRDLCLSENIAISRVSVNSIIRKITYTGHRFKDDDTVENLSKLFYQSIVSEFEQKDIVLTKSEHKRLMQIFCPYETCQ